MLDRIWKWCLLLGFLVTAVIGIEARYAPAGFVKQIDQRLDTFIKEDKLDNIENRLFYYDQKYGKGCSACDVDLKEVYHKLSVERKKLWKDLYENEDE